VKRLLEDSCTAWAVGTVCARGFGGVVAAAAAAAAASADDSTHISNNIYIYIYTPILERS
jgi:hypothetical protein